MGQLDTREKLAILADAVKYDPFCASSGTTKRDSRADLRVLVSKVQQLDLFAA